MYLAPALTLSSVRLITGVCYADVLKLVLDTLIKISNLLM